MQVGTTTSSTAATTPSKQERDAIGYDAFLQLLIAQLKHQDPLKPIDSTEYVSQLATLSNLEQAIKQNEKLEAVISSSSTAQALSMLGHTVTSKDGSITGRVISAVAGTDGVHLTLEDGRSVLLEEGMRFQP